MINLNELDSIIKSIDVDINEEDLLNFLKISKRWPYRYPWGQPSVEILCQNDFLESDHFFNLNNFLDFQKWKKFYDLGFTTIISNILDLNKDLRKINQKLTEATGLRINGNLYFSKPGKKTSFDYHNHGYDVIVKQIYGTSEWKIDGKTFIMNAKDTCIIPKNTLHQVLSKNENKLSLTINIQ